MRHILLIVLDTTLSLIGLAGIVWFFCRGLKNSEDPAKIIFKCIITAVLTPFCFSLAFAMGYLGPIVIAIWGISMSIVWTPHISDFLISPLTNMFDGGNEPPEPKPYYSIALSKQKLNKPLEAVVEIRKQLAKFPNDFEGVTLLANIQAEDMKDLQSAEITFNHFCNLENAPPQQVAAALTQIADWHLKLAQDSDSARAALEKIVARFPDTELALAAKQRIAHLGGTEKILLAPHDRHPVFVPEGIQSAGLRETMQDLVPEETDPKKLAVELIKHLQQYPQDTEAREKLAVIYAHHYERLDLAEMELAQLINEPNHPPKHVAHWLNLLADLQIQGGADFETVSATLEQIVKKFPDLPVAERARARRNFLKLEIKGRQEKTPDKKLGIYEQNIGLKYGPAYGSLGRKL